MIIREATLKDAFAICNISCADLGYDCSCEFVSTRISNLDKGREKVFVAVGTLHYFASPDIIDFLTESGYTVEVV